MENVKWIKANIFPLLYDQSILTARCTVVLLLILPLLAGDFYLQQNTAHIDAMQQYFDF